MQTDKDVLERTSADWEIIAQSVKWERVKLEVSGLAKETIK